MACVRDELGTGRDGHRRDGCTGWDMYRMGYVRDDSDKANIVREVLTGPLITECPASLLQTHPDLVVMLDDGAAALLK